MPTATRTFRVFVSSTFEDLKAERDALQRDVFQSVIVTPDGRRAVSAAGYGEETLRVWDLGTGECLRTLEGHGKKVTSVSVTPDGRCAVSGSFDCTLRVWDLETGSCLRTLKGHSDWVSSVNVTPNGRRVVSGSGDKTLRVWNLETGAYESVTHASATVASSALFAPLSRLIAGTSAGEVIIYDARGIANGLTWGCPETGEPVPADPEAQLHQEATACLRL
jgi:WD40 repeat protein